MNRLARSIALSVFPATALLAFQGQNAAQPAAKPDPCSQPTTADQITKCAFDGIVTKVKTAKQQYDQAVASKDPTQINLASATLVHEALDQIGATLKYLAYADVHPFLSQLEQKRIDVQVGSNAASSGSTSLVSKGSVPALLGFAVENGALTQSTSGTTVTFRGRPAAIVKTLAKQDFLSSGSSEVTSAGLVNESSTWYQALNRASFALSFDTSRGATPGTFTGNAQQLSGYSFRYDLRNHRDPRDPVYQKAWTNLRNQQQAAYAQDLSDLQTALLGKPEYMAWRAKAMAALQTASTETVEKVFYEQLEAQKAFIDSLPEMQPYIRRAVAAANTYFDQAAHDIDAATKSVIITFEYADTRQAPQATTTSTTAASSPAAVSTTASTPLPELANYKFIMAGHFLGDAEFTLNASTTLFQNIPAGLNTGRVRDYQGSAEFDFPLRKLGNLGKPTLSFSGLVLRLLEQPLGAPVTVNGQNVDSRGTTGYAQAKVEIPTKNSGVKIPLSVSWASRPELITEQRKWGANVGLTFDLDSLLMSK